MATIDSIKSTVNTNIRTETQPRGITPGDVSDIFDSTLNEITDRGIVWVAAYANIASLNTSDTKTAGTLDNGNIYRHNGTTWVLINEPGSGIGGGGSSDWNDITNKPPTFTPSAHAHPISDITSLQAILDAKAASSHTHTKSQITDFAHTHIIADTTGLQAALDSKQATLISGTSIKSINGQSLLGSGNLVVGATNKVVINTGINTSYTYPAESMINRVVVITTGALTAFRVGNTVNGEELFPDTPLDASSTNVIGLNFYSALTGTIYFYGITSSTTLILYYE